MLKGGGADSLASSPASGALTWEPPTPQLSASQPTCARVGAQPSPPLLSALILLSIFSSHPQGPADTEGSVAVGVLLDEYFMLGRAYCTAPPARQLPALPGCLLEEASAGRGTSQAQALPPSKRLPVAVPSDLGGGRQTHTTFQLWRGGIKSIHQALFTEQ